MEDLAGLTEEIERMRREKINERQRVNSEINELTTANKELAETLGQAREQIVQLKTDLARLALPPASFGVVVSIPDGDYVDIMTNGRKMRVQISPTVERDKLQNGQEVILNDSMTIIQSLDFLDVGEIVTFKEYITEDRVLAIGRTDEERVIRLSEPLLNVRLRSGDALLVESRTNFAYEKITKSEVEELVLEEVPDIDYEDIGGLGAQIEMIRDAVELPYLHAELFREYDLRPPKGILLYGPPGCGKTLIAKAVANSLAKKVAKTNGQGAARSHFLNIKGPELLNKFVGETERHIRLVFQRAREKATEGTDRKSTRLNSSH